MEELIFVTHNRSKMKEANEVAKDHGIMLIMPRYVGKLEIQAGSVSEVSEYAAREAYKRIRRPLLVDDSGLFIHALNDFPGVYTSPTLESIGNRGLLKLMDGMKDRSADSQCALSFFDGKRFRCFVGKMNGTILKGARGIHGFGFDPIFCPKGYKNTSLAELSLSEKNKISHRGKAFEAFFRWYCR